MPKAKTLTKVELRSLKAIKRDANLRKNLEAFATKTGKFTYKQIRSKWTYLNKTVRYTDFSGSVRNPKVKSYEGVQTSKIKPYVLERGVTVTARGDQQLRAEVMKKMKPNLLAMGVRTHTLPIYTSDQRAFRELVKDKDFVGRVYGTTRIPGNPKMVRVYRKM